MDSLISGIIDCVARPSTTDSPIRVIRKSASESPKCISSDPGLITSMESAHTLGVAYSDSESSSSNAVPFPPNHMDGAPSSPSFSRLILNGEPTPINSVLTAEGIVMGDERNFICGSCGDCATGCYENNGMGDDGTTTSFESIDNTVIRQFEAAFATFLYKNPAFTSMSHTTVQKLRSKLLRESAKNIRSENELRRQLEEIRQAKRNREMELQRELLVVTRAKAARESELLINIHKTRHSSMKLDQQMKKEGISLPSAASLSPTELRSGFESPPTITSSTSVIAGSDSFEEFQKEIQKNKIEQAHILAEMQRIKMQIAKDTVAANTGTP